MGRRGALAACTTLATTASACGGDVGSAARPDGGSPNGGPPVAPITPAVYTTRFAFVGFGGEPASLFLSLRNRTSAETLDLRYVGWLRRVDEWQTVLDIRERTGTPRAAWRVLPTGPLRILIGEGEDIVRLVVVDSATGIRLDIGSSRDEWTSATGQRESLRSGRLQVDGDTLLGIVLTSQTARLVGAPAANLVERVALLADTLGNALLVLRSARDDRIPVVVRTLLGGSVRRWDEAGVQVMEDEEGREEDEDGQRWNIEVPEAELSGELTFREVPAEDPAWQEEGEIRLLVASGELTIADEVYAMHGYAVERSGR